MPAVCECWQLQGLLMACLAQPVMERHLTIEKLRAPVPRFLRILMHNTCFASQSHTCYSGLEEDLCAELP